MSIRENLAEIATAEAKKGYTVAAGKNSGKQIEKYLAPFRDIFCRRAGNNYYKNTNNGFAWCGAFVYYCCLKAGIDLPLEPFEDEPTFALVSTWHKFAITCNYMQWFTGNELPQRGDLIIFKYLTPEGSEYEHIGIVELYNSITKDIICAEGNVKYTQNGVEVRRATLKKRFLPPIFKGLIRINDNYTS